MTGWPDTGWSLFPPKRSSDVKDIPAPAAAPAGVPVRSGSLAKAPPAEPTEVEQLVSELREAARQAGLQRDDPMMPLLTAFARGIRFLGERTAASDRSLAESSKRITDALLLARSTADAEAARFRDNLGETETRTVQRVSAAIGQSAERALAHRIRVFDRNTALLAAFVLFATAIGCLGGGYWWGSRNAYADIHQTENGLREAFNGGDQAARIWLNLISWNNITHSLALCSEPGLTHLQDHRKVCDVPLWIEKP
jgi:hypothetical protein